MIFSKWPRVACAFGFAVLAGFVDVVSFDRWSVFAGIQTGNIVFLGQVSAVEPGDFSL